MTFIRVSLHRLQERTGRAATPLKRTSLGAWNLFLALEGTGSSTATAELQSLSLNWRADQLGIYERSTPPAMALVWRIDFVDEPTATRAMQVLAGGLPGITVRQQGTSLTVATASDGGPVAWSFALNVP